MFERLGETDYCAHFADVNVHTHTHNKHEQFLQKIPLVMRIYSGNWHTIKVKNCNIKKLMKFTVLHSHNFVLCCLAGKYEKATLLMDMEKNADCRQNICRVLWWTSWKNIRKWMETNCILLDSSMWVCDYIQEECCYIIVFFLSVIS